MKEWSLRWQDRWTAKYLMATTRRISAPTSQYCVASSANIQILSSHRMSVNDRRECLTLGTRLLERYRVVDINVQLRNLPLQSFYLTAAPLSGPIAALYNKYEAKQYVFADKYEKSILIFSARGELKKMLSFELKERIILFAFTTDETLLVVYATGQYSLIDPYSGNRKEGGYLEAGCKERFVGAQLVNDTLVMIKEKTLGVVRALTGGFEAIPLIKLHPDNLVFNCCASEAGAIEVAYLSKDAQIQCVDLTKGTKRLLFDLNSPKLLISLTLNGPNLALLLENGLAYYVGVTADKTFTKSFQLETSFTKENSFNKSKSRYKYRNNYFIGWLSGAAVFCDRQNMVIFDERSKVEILGAGNCGYLLAETDGIRSIADCNSLFRIVNRSYAKLVGGLWPRAKEDSAEERLVDKLQEDYRRYLGKEVIDIRRMNESRKEVSTLLERVVEDASLCVDTLEQLKILKFAMFLKNYYEGRENREITNLSEDLRVVNNWRHEGMGRWLTLKQFRFLKDKRYLVLLLRYNMHFLADIIFQDSESKERIFFHWCKCKIAKENQLAALQEIKAKYAILEKRINSTRVFTQLAKYSLEREKAALALKLIQFQKHPDRRLMVALLILSEKKDTSFIEKILEFAEECSQCSLIYTMFKQLRRLSASWLAQDAWLQLLHKKPLLEAHYLKYLTQTGEMEELQKYLQQQKMLTELGYLRLEAEICAVDSLQTLKEKICSDYKKILPGLAVSITKCIQYKSVLFLRELKRKTAPITEDQCSQVDGDMDLEYLSQIVITKDGNLPLAVRLIKKIKSERVYELLRIRGKMRDAMEVAHSRKDKAMLRELIEKSSEDIEVYGQQLLRSLQGNK